MEIENEMPIILTKDNEWAEQMKFPLKFSAGQVIIIPEDAVLVRPKAREG